MLRPLIAALLLPSAAHAAERTVGVGSFDRVRVEGTFDVRITTGRSPRATVSGDARAIEWVDLQVNGTTLSLRRRSGAGAGAAMRASEPVVVTLSAPTLQSAAMLGGGKLGIAGMRTDRALLSVSGAGEIAATGIDAREAQAIVVGGGRITLAGRAIRVRLWTNGPGAIDARSLVADDLTVRLDGPGDTQAQARYLATVTTTGLGRVTVAGKPRCTVRAPAGGAVTCGAP